MTGRNSRFYIETLGCALNQADTNLIIQLLREKGWRPTEDPREADVLIVNTCTVRKDSEEKSIKIARRLKKTNPHAKLVITGCMASAQPYTLRRIFPDSILVAPENTHLIARAVESMPGENILSPVSGKRMLVPTVRKGAIAIIPLNEGCLGKCSFCLTVKARRRLLSRNPKDIVRTVESLVKKGVYEIQLASQDSGVYGIDIAGKPLLPSLVNQINDIVEGEYALRIGMMNPNWALRMIDELVEALKRKHTYKFLHIPLQSGDNHVLKLMNREYTAEEFVELSKELKRKVHNITIATDVIVGHPGESEEAFRRTIETLREADVDRIHIARYSPRPHTISARLPQIPDPIKKERSRMLMKIYENIGYRKHSLYVGKTLEAVVVEDWGFNGKRSLTARTINYLSIVLPWDDHLKPGTIVKARIQRVTYYDLRGEVLEARPTRPI